MSTKAMLEVLEEAAASKEATINLLSGIAEKGSAALEGLDLTLLEKAAIISGDVRFIESRIGGKLDERIVNGVMVPLCL